jgi:hypothetical protein
MVIPSKYQPAFEEAEEVIPHSRGDPKGRTDTESLGSSFLRFLLQSPSEQADQVKRTSAFELYDACIQENIGLRDAEALWRSYASEVNEDLVGASRLRLTPRMRHQ